jgi:hypothetical protein
LKPLFTGESTVWNLRDKLKGVLSEKDSNPTKLGVIRPKTANAIGLFRWIMPTFGFPRDLERGKEGNSEKQD